VPKFGTLRVSGRLSAVIALNSIPKIQLNVITVRLRGTPKLVFWPNKLEKQPKARSITHWAGRALGEGHRPFIFLLNNFGNVNLIPRQRHCHSLEVFFAGRRPLLGGLLLSRILRVPEGEDGPAPEKF
jgi:hypothetical protein